MFQYLIQRELIYRSRGDVNRRVGWDRKQVAADRKSPETVISCCVTFSLPTRPVKIGQTTLDKLVEILKTYSLLLLSVWAMSFPQSMTLIQIQVAILLLMGGT